METTETTNTLIVHEKPELKDQVITAVVGAAATIVVTAAVQVGMTALQTAIANRQMRKEAAKLQEETEQE